MKSLLDYEGRTILHLHREGYETMFKRIKSNHLPGLKNHPNNLCWICALDGIISPTHTIDHLKPINREDPFDTKNGQFGEPLKWENLGPLCKVHTMRKNALERNGHTNLGEIVKKLRKSNVEGF